MVENKKVDSLSDDKERFGWGLSTSWALDIEIISACFKI